MKFFAPRPLVLLAAAFALVPIVAGCAARDRTGYPSLAPRAVEKQGFGEPDQPAPAPVRADPALDATLATATADLARAKAGFDEAATRAARATTAARGAGVGTEAWIAAQTLLAELDGWRAQTQDVVSTLEDLAIARAAALAAPYPALETTRAAATAEVTRETTRIDALQATLPRA